MGNLIVTPHSSLESAPEVKQNVLQTLRSNGHDLSYLDSSHPNFSPSEQYEILKARYEKNLIDDGIASGHFVLNRTTGEIDIAIAQRLPIIVGYIFEAFTVRKVNENKNSIGKQAFLWATEARRVTSKRLDQFHAGGVGHVGIPPQLRNPALRQFDVVFYRMNPARDEPEPAPVIKTSIPAGIQVKAITGNESSAILQLLREKTYRRVLTYLRHPDGRHSYEVCMALIKNLLKEGEIDQKESRTLEEAIASPEKIGIDQKEVDDYYHYIRAWYRQQAKHDDTILKASILQIAEENYGQALITTLP